MSRTAKPKKEVFPIIYRAEADMPEIAPTYIAFLGRWLTHKKTKEKVFDILPVYFRGDTRSAVEAKAVEFWEVETAKARALKERPAKAAAARRKSDAETTH